MVQYAGLSLSIENDFEEHEEEEHEERKLTKEAIPGFIANLLQAVTQVDMLQFRELFLGLEDSCT